MKFCLVVLSATVAVASAGAYPPPSGDCYYDGKNAGYNVGKAFCKLPRTGTYLPAPPRVLPPCNYQAEKDCKAKMAYWANENCADVKALRGDDYLTYKEYCEGTVDYNAGGSGGSGGGYDNGSGGSGGGYNPAPANPPSYSKPSPASGSK